MKTFTILLLFALTGIAANAEFRLVALYPSPFADPERKDVEPRILAFFEEKKIKIRANGSATIWISVSVADFPKARAVLIEAVKRKEFEPTVVYVPEAWKTRADKVSYYDFDFAETCIREELEPNKPQQHNAGRRPSSSDSPESETPSPPGSRG